MIPQPLDSDTLPEDDDAPPRPVVTALFVLAVLWCRDEPWRIGEVLIAPPSLSRENYCFGRGEASEERPPKAYLSQLRPGLSLPSPAFGALSISRYQLRLESNGDQLLLRNEGRATLFHNGREVGDACCSHGDLIQLGKQLLFACVRRPVSSRTPPSYPDFPFGGADAHGIVGESAAAWQLRGQIAFVAPRRDAVLVHGSAGSGNELVVHAIHALSSRAQRRLVSCRALSVAGGPLDAELFGNCENYPGPGLPEKLGLLVEAHGSTLFVDDFAELPARSQVQLLRSVEEGSHVRLGDRKLATSDVRLLVTSGREPASLEQGVSARFGFTLHVPDLNERREDIPLLVRHLLRQGAQRGDDVARRCFPEGNLHSEPIVPLALMRHLVELDYRAHVRQLKAEIWRALAAEQLGLDAAASSGSLLSTTVDAVDADRSVPPPSAALAAGAADSVAGELSARSLQEALDQNNGVLEATWRALGLKNRFVLVRLIKRHRLEIRKRPAVPRGRDSTR